MHSSCRNEGVRVAVAYCTRWERAGCKETITITTDTTSHIITHTTGRRQRTPVPILDHHHSKALRSRTLGRLAESAQACRPKSTALNRASPAHLQTCVRFQGAKQRTWDISVLPLRWHTSQYPSMVAVAPTMSIHGRMRTPSRMSCVHIVLPTKRSRRMHRDSSTCRCTFTWSSPSGDRRMREGNDGSACTTPDHNDATTRQQSMPLTEHDWTAEHRTQRGRPHTHSPWAAAVWEFQTRSAIRDAPMRTANTSCAVRRPR